MCELNIDILNIVVRVFTYICLDDCDKNLCFRLSLNCFQISLLCGLYLNLTNIIKIVKHFKVTVSNFLVVHRIHNIIHVYE